MGFLTRLPLISFYTPYFSQLMYILTIQPFHFSGRRDYTSFNQLKSLVRNRSIKRSKRSDIPYTSFIFAPSSSPPPTDCQILLSIVFLSIQTYRSHLRILCHAISPSVHCSSSRCCCKAIWFQSKRVPQALCNLQCCKTKRRPRRCEHHHECVPVRSLLNIYYQN